MPLDTSENRKITDSIERFNTEVRSKAEDILVKGAVKIKKNLQEDARGSKYFKQFAKKISYDTTRRKNTTEVEIGPVNDKIVKKGGGPGAAIAYFGGANGGGGTLDFDEPVEREFDTIDRYLGELGDSL